MKRNVVSWLPAVAGLLWLASPAAAQPAPAAPPVPEAAETASEEDGGWLESLLYNPAERSEKGRQALKASAPQAASAALDTALRLDPQNEPTRYNAGTAHLLAESEKAAPLLEAAARSQDKALAARAYYNLGNARLAAKDLPGAVEAYKNSLRRDPTNADAKFNLELALRRLQEEQKQNQQSQNQDQQNKDQQKQDQQKQDQQNQDQQNQDQQNQDQKSQDQQKQDQQKQDQQQDDKKDGQEGQSKEDQGQQQQQQQPQQQQGQKGQKESPLPQFRDLKDMDAQQAAAILEAIENLERSQRRQDAKKAQKANVRGKKDW